MLFVDVINKAYFNLAIVDPVSQFQPTVVFSVSLSFLSFFVIITSVNICHSGQQLTIIFIINSCTSSFFDEAWSLKSHQMVKSAN